MANAGERLAVVETQVNVIGTKQTEIGLNVNNVDTKLDTLIGDFREFMGKDKEKEKAEAREHLKTKIQSVGGASGATLIIQAIYNWLHVGGNH